MHHPRPHPLHETPQEHQQHMALLHHQHQHTQVHHDHVSGNSEPLSTEPHHQHPQHHHMDHWDHSLHHPHPHVHHHNECRDHVTIVAYADLIISQFEMALCIYLLVKTIGFTIHSHEDMPRVLHVLTGTALVQLFMCLGGTYLSLKLFRATKPMTLHSDAVKLCRCWQVFNFVQILFEFIIIVISDISMEYAIPAGNGGFLFVLDRIFGIAIVHRYALQLDHIMRANQQAAVNPETVPEVVMNHLVG